ncbi:MAG: hypothetical protein IPL65_21645, partial [Lewinellaceae bacterium]|nr:hypothetical protein [Lewinellaceae bacterium]
MVSGVQYDWTGPGGFSANTASISVSNAGTYTSTVTALNGCQTSQTVTIPENTLPPVLNAIGDALSCIQTAGGIVVSSNVPLEQIVWSGPGGFSASTAQAMVQLSGTYTVIGTAANGCTASVTTEVIADTLPPVFNALQQGVISCADTSALLIGDSPDPGITLVWTGIGGAFPPADTVVVSMPGIYQMIATGLNGCTGAAMVVVPADTMAPVVLASGGTVDCSQPVVLLSANTAQTGLNYSWTGPSGFASTQQDTFTSQSGTYTLLVTAPNGCTSISTALVQEDFSPPVLSAQVDVMVLNCANTEAVLTAISAPGTQYEWMDPQGALSVGNPLLTSLPGNYIVVATGQNGCTASAALLLTQDTIAPFAAAIGDTLDCFSPDVTITGSSTTPGVQFQWSGPGGFSSMQPAVLVALPGVYTLTVVAPNGCTTTATAEVFPDEGAPDLNIQAPSPITCLTPTATLTANSSSTGVVYNWSGPMGFTAMGDTVQTDVPGQYTVQVQAPNGCSATQTVSVTEDTDAPDVSATAGVLNCINVSAALTGTSMLSGVTYQWMGPAGFNSNLAITQT